MAAVKAREEGKPGICFDQREQCEMHALDKQIYPPSGTLQYLIQNESRKDITVLLVTLIVHLKIIAYPDPLKMELSSVHLARPSPSLFQFPPRKDPQTLQPPSIPIFYHEALNIAIPITASCFYAATVQVLNAFNWSNSGKPWTMSKTRIYFYVVAAHNILLATYSIWTFIGMFGALTRTVQSPAGPTGIVGFVDSLCKIHGTAGLGNGITYRPTTSQWVYEPPSFANDRSPSPADRGRLWNEGLSFYGWIFYWSKIYEFFDTVIILTKGKQGSILQVYHHIGALMCTWAGIRYMSSPIWIPTFVNSGVHSLMVRMPTHSVYVTDISVSIPTIL